MQDGLCDLQHTGGPAMDNVAEPRINTKYFHVFKRGRLTVVGFEGKHLSDFSSISECRDSLLNLADHPECEVLVVDLMDVEIVSSWLLGILAAVQQRGIEVHLYHPSEEIRGVLDVTRFDELMTVRKGLK
jgi:anti-anti-sigma factor